MESFFDFELTGLFEQLQFTVYEEAGSHYDWHLDKMLSDLPPRKLSLVLQLSDPEEYTGGDLELFVSSNPIKIERKRGLLTAFPSFTLHRVTPVTSGIRKSLVAWVGGPKFK
jgi:PKHD-type hydroxylase